MHSDCKEPAVLADEIFIPQITCMYMYMQFLEGPLESLRFSPQKFFTCTYIGSEEL